MSSGQDQGLLQSRQSGIGARSRATIEFDKVQKETDDYKNAKWGSPGILLIVLLIVVLIIVLVLYYNLYTNFNTKDNSVAGALPGVFAKAPSWLTLGHGILLYLAGMVGIVGAAMAVALMFPENDRAMSVGTIVGSMLSLLFYLAVKSLADQASSWWIWSALFVIATVGAGFIGWYYFGNFVKEATTPADQVAKLPQGDQEAVVKFNKMLEMRSWWTIGSFVASILGGGVSAVGFWFLPHP
jgi:hypothetical protein